MHGWEKGRQLMGGRKWIRKRKLMQGGEVGKWGRGWNRRGWGCWTRTSQSGSRDMVSLGSSLLHLSLTAYVCSKYQKTKLPQPSSPPQLDAPLSLPITHFCVPHPGSITPRLPSCVLGHFVLLPKVSPAPRGPSKFWPSSEDPCKPPAPWSITSSHWGHPVWTMASVSPLSSSLINYIMVSSSIPKCVWLFQTLH